MKIVRPIPRDTPGSNVKLADPEDSVDEKPEDWVRILSRKETCGCEDHRLEDVRGRGRF
jgi:hypothetical protein